MFSHIKYDDKYMPKLFLTLLELQHEHNYYFDYVFVDVFFTCRKISIPKLKRSQHDFRNFWKGPELVSIVFLERKNRYIRISVYRNIGIGSDRFLKISEISDRHIESVFHQPYSVRKFRNSPQGGSSTNLCQVRFFVIYLLLISRLFFL